MNGLIEKKARANEIRTRLRSNQIEALEEKVLLAEMVKVDAEVAELEHQALAVFDPEAHARVERTRAFEAELANEGRVAPEKEE